MNPVPPAPPPSGVLATPNPPPLPPLAPHTPVGPKPLVVTALLFCPLAAPAPIPPTAPVRPLTAPTPPINELEALPAVPAVPPTVVPPPPAVPPPAVSTQRDVAALVMVVFPAFVPGFPLVSSVVTAAPGVPAAPTTRFQTADVAARTLTKRPAPLPPVPPPPLTVPFAPRRPLPDPAAGPSNSMMSHVALGGV